MWLQKAFEAFGNTGFGRHVIRRADMALARRPEKRVLGVWPFHTMSGSIGDAMVFHENLLCVMYEHGLEKVDVAFIDDTSHPNTRETRYQFGEIWKRNVMSMNCVNPHLGSVFVFDSQDSFLHFSHAHRRQYVMYPFLRDKSDIGWDERLADMCSKRPKKRRIGDFDVPRIGYDLRIMDSFQEKYGFIPRLSCGREVLARVDAFIAREVAPALPVTIQIRRNPLRQPTRNVDLENWLEVVRTRVDDPSIRFIALGHPEELAELPDDMPNLIRSKDFFSSIEEDLALVQRSHVCIFNLGGLLPFALYSGKPCLMFGTDMRLIASVHGLRPDRSMPHYTKFQRMFWGKMEGWEIVNEFDRLVNDLGEAGSNVF